MTTILLLLLVQCKLRFFSCFLYDEPNLYLDGDGLHMQRVFVERVKRIVPHDFRLGNVAAATSEHEQGLIQLHGFIYK